MDKQLRSILKYWYIPPTDVASANCERVTVSTILLHVTLWSVATTVHLILGSVHVRHWIRRCLHITAQASLRTVNLYNYVHVVGVALLVMGCNLASAAVLSRGDSTISFANALALWFLRPTASTLICAISFIFNREVYSDAAGYTAQGEVFLATWSIWPFAVIGGATRNIHQPTREFLHLFDIDKTAIPLLRAGSALGIVHWILCHLFSMLFSIIWTEEDTQDDDLPFNIVIFRQAAMYFNALRLLSSCLVWLGALFILGDPQVCAFYLDPQMRAMILVMWTAESIAEALWSALFPSSIPWEHRPGKGLVKRNWRHPDGGTELRSVT